MVDKEDVPQKIDLENADRAPVGDDPLVRLEEDDFSTATKQKVGDFFRQKITDGNIASTAAIKNKPDLEVFNDRMESPSEDSYMAEQPSTTKQAFDDTGESGNFNQTIVPGERGDLNNETELQASLLLEQLSKEPEVVASQVSETISENAVFSPDAIFVDNTRPSEDDAGTGAHVIQTGLGTHVPKKPFDGQQSATQAESAITIKNLRSLGCQILLEASGEIYVPDDFEDTAQVVAARGSTTAAPGLARLGFRVDTSRFGAREILNNVNKDYVKPTVEFDLDGPAKPSFGNVNNPLVPFSAISSGASSVLVGTLLVTTFTGIFAALAASLNDAANTEAVGPGTGHSESPSAEELTRTRLGHFIPEETKTVDFGTAIFGTQGQLLITTQNDYTACVQEGAKAFFGVDLASDGPLSAATRIVETPGYYNGILRLLVRSISDPLSAIIGNAQDLAGGAGSPHFSKTLADYDPLVGPANDPFTLIESVRLIKESRFLKFMNTIAKIGDISLSSFSRSADNSSIDSYRDAVQVERLGDMGKKGDTLTMPNPAALIRKSRLSDNISHTYNNSMAWGANTLPSLYLINKQILDAETAYAQTYNYSSIGTKENFAQSVNKRLSAEDVTEIENRLDSYYMPFYFHDLRTNEIVAFHAFLENIADNHTADYNENEGYGRIGKVYTYKNTNRAISLSFKVLAVSQKDFDAMWFKLNKILMMLYPQYTLGRTISHNNQKFVQPFSQLPSASPMIRMRVGDLIKTNFSEFDLARLFGVGSEHFNVSAARAQQVTNAQRQEYYNKHKEIVTRQSKPDPVYQQSERFKFVEKVDRVGNVNAPARSATRASDSLVQKKRDTENRRTTPLTDRARRAARAADRTRHAAANFQGDIPVGTVGRIISSNGSVYTFSTEPALAGSDSGTQYEINLGNPAAVELIGPHETSIQQAAEAHANSRQQANSAQATEDNQQIDDDVRTFFSDANDDTGTSSRAPTPQQKLGGVTGGTNVTQGGNAIMKSFASTRGKGLAGFIKSLQFNWEGALWETENANSKAPKWCTVSMEFAPIHDLNPGIDVDGNMIAPIYNVGSILQQMKIRRAQHTEDASSAARAVAAKSQTSPTDIEDGSG